MFDYLRNLTKSDVEKQQEAVNAYLDDALTPQDKQRFEQRLVQNPDLQAEVSQLRGLKQQMRGLPQRRVPRNFMLDPQKYGRPQSAFLTQSYPFLRTATALTAFFFVIALAANVFLGDFNGGTMTETASMSVPAPESSNIAELSVEETVAEQTAVEEGEVIEITRVVTEEIMATTVTERVEEAAVAMDEEAAPELQSEEAGIEMQRESAPVAEMPIDATAMIAGTTKFDEADVAASNDLEVPASEESAEGLDPSITIPQAEATQIAEQTDNDESAMRADDSVSNRETSNETMAQAQSVVDPWYVLIFLLGVLLLILLFLTLLARRRL